MTADEVLQKVRLKWPAKSAAVLPAVADRVGRPERFADVVVMELFPSRGLSLSVVEIKVSRSDFLKEMRTPEKAESINAFCDYQWIAAPAGVIHPEDLPPGWGLLEATATKATIKKKPVLNPHRREPDRVFLASLLRALQKNVSPEAEIERRVQEAVAQERHRHNLQFREMEKRAEESYQSLRRAVDEFEAASGIRINKWDAKGAGEVGAIVKAIMHDRQGHLVRELETRLLNLSNGVANAKEQIDRFLRPVQDAAKTWRSNHAVLPNEKTGH